MITLAKYKMEDILPHIGVPGRNYIQLNTNQGIFSVKTNSTRLQCFSKSRECVRCRRNGDVWLLQSHVQKPSKVSHNCFIRDCAWCISRPKRPVGKMDAPHLNLYHSNRKGRLILMTQDHIYPKSRGGSNGVENMQTMCTECNSFKAAMLPEEYEKVMMPHERAIHLARLAG